MKCRTVLQWLAIAALAAATGRGALAHGDEDHGAPAAAATQGVLPRVLATTEDFELVGVLEADRLLLYLDRQTSNEPVLKARIEVEGAGLNDVASESAPGLYTLSLGQPLASGRHAMTFTVQAGELSDLMLGALDLPAPAVLNTPPAATALAWWPWLGGAGVVSAAGLGLMALRRRQVKPAL